MRLEQTFQWPLGGDSANEVVLKATYATEKNQNTYNTTDVSKPSRDKTKSTEFRILQDYGIWYEGPFLYCVVLGDRSSLLKSSNLILNSNCWLIITNISLETDCFHIKAPRCQRAASTLLPQQFPSESIGCLQSHFCLNSPLQRASVQTRVSRGLPIPKQTK